MASSWLGRLLTERLVILYHPETPLELKQMNLTFEQRVIDRLARIETEVRFLRTELIGDGQPGRLAVIERRLRKLEAKADRQAGFVGAIAAIVGALVSALVGWLRGSH